MSRAPSWSLKCMWLKSLFLLYEKHNFSLFFWLVSNCSPSLWLLALPAFTAARCLPNKPTAKCESLQGWEAALCGFILGSFSLIILSFPAVCCVMSINLAWLKSPGSKDSLGYNLGIFFFYQQSCSSYFTFIWENGLAVLVISYVDKWQVGGMWRAKICWGFVPGWQRLGAGVGPLESWRRKHTLLPE